MLKKKIKGSSVEATEQTGSTGSSSHASSIWTWQTLQLSLGACVKMKSTKGESVGQAIGRTARLCPHTQSLRKEEARKSIQVTSAVRSSIRPELPNQLLQQQATVLLLRRLTWSWRTVLKLGVVEAYSPLVYGTDTGTH